MPRVLLVDDEGPFRRALLRMIEGADPDYTIVGEAFDGEQAFELIPALLPDVLITDIRMPVMDGLQLIAAVKRSYPDMITVIVSSHDDFDYTRKAIQLGADDYLLKPLTVLDLNELLLRVKRSVHEYEMKRDLGILRTLMENGDLNSLPESLKFPSYTLILACAGSYSKTYVDPLHPGKVFWQALDFETKTTLHHSAVSNCWMLDGDRENERMIIIGGPSEHSDTASSEMCRNLLTSADRFGIPLTLVYGHASADLTSLLSTIQSYSRMMMKSVIFSKSALVAIDRPIEQGSLVRDEHLQLESRIDIHHYTDFLQGLFDLCEKWKREAVTQAQMDAQLKQILFACKEKLSISGDELIRASLEIDSLLSHSLAYDELYEGAAYIFKGLFETAGSAGKSASYQDEMVNEIQSYLQENYALPITLQDLSKRFGLVPNYLSALFKKLRGVTPGEYLTQWRVEQAKRMMDGSPVLLLKEISERVGYNDPLYFSRVFKKITGRSPSDYLR